MNPVTRSSLAGLVLAIATAALATQQHEPAPKTISRDSNVNSDAAEQTTQGRGVRYPRASYVWPHVGGPFYGTVDRRQRRAPGVLHTAVGSFHLDAGPLPIPDALKSPNRLDELGAQYYVVQVDPHTVDAAGWRGLRRVIELHGGRVMRPMAVSALLARLTPAALAAIQDSAGLIAVEPWHPAFKLDPTIGRTPLRDPVKALSEIYELEISIFEGEQPHAVAQQITALGGRVTQVMADRVRAELHVSKLAEVARLEAVYMIHERLPVLPHAEETTTGIQTGGYRFGATPYHDAGITGAGQILMLLDTGIQLDAADLADSHVAPGTPGPGHRKVRFYGTTEPFGGGGDALGCDAPLNGGITHGHVVAAAALGNADHAAAGA